MNFVNQVPILVLHILKADISENSSVVDQDIDAAKGLDSGIYDLVAELNTVVVRNGLSASCFDLLDNDIGSLDGRINQIGSAPELARHGKQRLKVSEALRFDVPLMTGPLQNVTHRGH